MKIIPNENKEEKKFIKVKKNIILVYLSDSTGCGHVRSIFPFTYINAVFGKKHDMNPIITSAFIRQQDILVRTRSILFQRQMTPEHLNMIRFYKNIQPQFKFKMIYDIDDLLWGKNEEHGGNETEGIPSYNFASDRVSEEMKQCSLESMKLMDKVTVSTQYLKDHLQNVEKIETPIEVLQNSVPVYLYGHRDKQFIQENIKKPKILLNQSPTHYSNVKKKKGDFNNAWCDYIIKNVKENKIDVSVIGGLPFYFEEIKDKIKVINWLNALQYPNKMKQIKPNFVISPLVYNKFNSAKSDIKKIETQAIGSVHIGTVFESGEVSPYDGNIVKIKDTCTVKEIEDTINSLCDKDIYNDLVNRGYKELEDQNRYTESSKYINQLVNIF